MIKSDIHNEDCFESSPIIPMRILKFQESCICKIFNIEGKIGTGFFCKLPYPNEFHLLPTLFTNNHVLNENNLKQEKIKIKYKDEEKYLKLDESRKKFTDEDLDVTIIEIRPDLDDIKDFLDIDLRCFKENYNETYKNDKKIYILQIPHGVEISFSYGEIIDIKKEFIYHKSSTRDGSSGSPILCQSNYQIIGLHRGFKKTINANIGMLINFIIDKFISYYPINPELVDQNFIQQQIDIYNSIKKSSTKKSEKKITKKKKKKTINKNIKNIIGIELENNNNSRDLYFLDNSENHDGLEELDKDNTEIYINNKKIEYQKHFEFSRGTFIIKIIINGAITDCSNMFINCNNIISLDLSQFDTENVINMKNMFKKCSNLININLSNFKTQNVNDMGHMFSSCENLSFLDISSFETNNVTNMSYMFYNCKNLTKIDLSNFNTENVTNMNNMFCSCDNLNNIIFTSSFNTMKVTKMNKMFKLCKNIRYLNLSFFNTKNVENMSEMFSICENLKNIDLISFNTQNVKDMSKMFNSCSSLKSLDLKNFNTQNVTNMSEMFKHCQNIDNINISSLFNTMNVENMKEMFFSCHKLDSIDLKYFNTFNVTNMNSMFANCDNLETLDLSSFYIKNATDMESMFNDCYKLRILNISNFDLKNASSYNNLFKNCKNLSDIYISKKIDDALIKYQLTYCSIKANINKI